MNLECPPRFGTPRNHDRPTRGPEIEAHALLLARSRFMPWQRYVVDVANEVDPDTGRLWYDTVVLVVPRQQGKTTMIEPTLVTAARRRPDVDVVYAAQDRQMSGDRLVNELAGKRLERRPEFAGRFTVRKSNGSESITWSNGSRIRTVANTPQAGHGLTLDLAVIDEAFAHRDLTVVTALSPATITRPDPQTWIVSTVGEGDDGLLLHYQDVGMAALSDPDTRVAYFEWSAPADADRTDPAVWRATMPALGHTITERAVRNRLTSVGPASFDRAYLCRRPTVSTTAAVDLELYAAGEVAAPVPITAPYVAAVHIAPDRAHTSVAVVGALENDTAGRVGVAVDRRPGTGWVVDQLAALQSRGAVAFVADRVAGAGGVIDRAAGRGVHVDELSGADVAGHCGNLFDELAQHTAVHDGHTDLTTAVNGSRIRPLGASFAWNQRTADVDLSPLAAWSYALGHYRRLFPTGAVHDRIA